VLGSAVAGRTGILLSVLTTEVDKAATTLVMWEAGIAYEQDFALTTDTVVDAQGIAEPDPGPVENHRARLSVPDAHPGLASCRMITRRRPRHSARELFPDLFSLDPQPDAPRRSPYWNMAAPTPSWCWAMPMSRPPSDPESRSAGSSAAGTGWPAHHRSPERTRCAQVSRPFP
jgi:hypothetical protein